MRDNLKAIGDAWTSYSPSWTGATTNPAIGNGTISGAYLSAGKFTLFRVQITMGSTTTYGSGQWRLSLPVAPVSVLWPFAAELRDTGAASYPGRAIWSSATSTIDFQTPATTAGNADRAVSSTVPFTWGSTDILFVSGMYEAA